MSGYFIYAQSFGWRCCVCIILYFCFFNFRFLLLIRASSGWLYVPPRQLVKRRDGTLCNSQKVLRMVKDNQGHSSTLRSVYIIDKPSLYLIGLLSASCFGRWFLILLVMTHKQRRDPCVAFVVLLRASLAREPFSMPCFCVSLPAIHAYSSGVRVYRSLNVLGSFPGFLRVPWRDSFC